MEKNYKFDATLVNSSALQTILACIMKISSCLLHHFLFSVFDLFPI